MRAACVVIVCLFAWSSLAAPRPQVAVQPVGVHPSSIPSAERQALLDLYSSTNGAGWTHNTNWNGAAGTECTWYGVTCDSGKTTVQRLDLSTNNLSGTLPATLGNLANLTNLIITYNPLSGSIPSQLGSLANLLVIDLGDNQLTGSIPVQLGGLTKLMSLNISRNQLSGSIPAQLGNLGNLRYLVLHANRLTGAMPTSLTNLTTLVANDSDIRWNGLYSNDATLTSFLTAKQYGGDWQSSQTVAPTGVTAGAATASSVTLSWIPITYTGDTGGYCAYFSTISGGSYNAGAITANKSATSLVVGGLNSGTLYYFVVRTVTNPGGSNSNTVTSDPSAEVHATTSGGTTPSYTAWIPVAAHNPGLRGSQWRSDLGLLNTGTTQANVQIKFFGSSGTVSNTTYVPAGTQSILTDVVGQLGASGQGALQVLSDQPLRVTSRTYNQVSSTESCYPNGTQGQDYPVLAADDGLAAGQSTYLGGLTENSTYRSNIGLVNVGLGAASVLVELYNGAGTKLTSYTVPLTAGQWAQETQPFKNKAAQTAMDRGYAKVTVQSGSGVFAFASVVDNLTNDPTTVTMQR